MIKSSGGAQSACDFGVRHAPPFGESAGADRLTCAAKSDVSEDADLKVDCLGGRSLAWRPQNKSIVAPRPWVLGLGASRAGPFGQNLRIAELSWAVGRRLLQTPASTTKMGDR